MATGLSESNSSVGDEFSTELSSSEFSFVSDDLNSFLNRLLLSSSKLTSSDEASPSGVDACAKGSAPRPSYPSSALSSPSGERKVVRKGLAPPLEIRCFDRNLAVEPSSSRLAKTVEFLQNPLAPPTDGDFRFPRSLERCYGADFFSSREHHRVTTSKKNRRLRRFFRFGLSTPTIQNDDCFPKSNSTPTPEDLRFVLKNAFPGHSTPFIYPCRRNEKSCVSCPLPELLRLFVEVGTYSSNGNRIVKTIVDRNNDVVVDRVSAVIAASAVQREHSQSRWFLPIPPQFRNEVDRAVDLMPRGVKVEVDDDVRRVVDDVLDFVERQPFVVPLKYDPDDFVSSGGSDVPSPSSSPNKIRRARRREKNAVIRELKKLINVSVTDERDDVDGESCRRPSCLLGCVCQSVSGKRLRATHCRRVDCMFGCECSTRFRPRPSLPGELAKNEKTWHQTIVRRRNDDVELQTEFERSTREKKPPSRFNNTLDVPSKSRSKRVKLVALPSLTDPNNQQTRTRLNTFNVSVDMDPETQAHLLRCKVHVQLTDIFLKDIDQDSPFRQFISTLDGPQYRVKVKNEVKEAFANTKRNYTSKRFACCKKSQARNLSDVLLWCAVHSKYDCLCTNWVLLLRNNNLVLKPRLIDRLSMFKSLSRSSLKNSPEISRQVILYDRSKHCARTVGSLCDYNKRNRTLTFAQMSAFKLKHNVPSYSNSFIRAKPLATLALDKQSSNHPVCSRVSSGVGVGEVVTMIPDTDDQASVEVDLYDKDPPTPEIHDLTLISSDEDSRSASTDLTFPAVSKESLFIDDHSEFVPKPTTQTPPPKFQPGFSSYRELVKRKLPAQPSPEVKEEPLPKCAKQDEIQSDDDDVEVVEVRPPSPIVIEDDDYPDHGLVSMSRPDLGYIVVRCVSAGQIVVEDPEDSSRVHTFSEAKAACSYIKTFMIQRVDSSLEKLEWSLVTRGVLEKYQCSEFDRSSVKPLQSVTSKKKKNPNGPRCVQQKVLKPGTLNTQSTPKPGFDRAKVVTLRPNVVTSDKSRLDSNQHYFIRVGPFHGANSGVVQNVITSPNSPPGSTKMSATLSPCSSNQGKSPANSPFSTTPKAVFLPKGLSSANKMPSSHSSLPLKVRLPPRRADVIIPRKDGFATLISPAPGPVKEKLLHKTEGEDVFNGVLVPKNGSKGYICDKKLATTKMAFRSLLQKRLK